MMPKDKQQKYLINNLFKRKSQNILEGIGKQLLICLSVRQKFMDHHKIEFGRLSVNVNST